MVSKESLNGEKNNYQFSARAVIDRYKSHDMPLGWLLPNDGYGGMDRPETLDINSTQQKVWEIMPVKTEWRSDFGHSQTCIRRKA